MKFKNLLLASAFLCAITAPAHADTTISSYPRGGLANTTDVIPVARPTNPNCLSAPPTCSYTTAGVFVGPLATQPSVLGTQLPLPTLSVLGGVTATTSAAHQFLTGLGTNGAFTQAQPTTSDINGLGTASAANIGTSGAVVGLLNGSNTESGSVTFTNPITGSVTGTAANITATTNSTLTSLPSLVIGTTQLSGVVPIANGGTAGGTSATGLANLLNNSGTGTITTLSTSLAQGVAGYFLSFNSTAGLTHGMIVSGANIPQNTVINQIGSGTASVTTTAAANGTGSSNFGGGTVQLASLANLNPWMIITDTTNPSAVNPQCTINQLVPGLTKIVSGCSLAGITSGDTLVLQPSIQLSQSTSAANSASTNVSFQTNTTNITAVNENLAGDLTVGGNLNNGLGSIMSISVGTTNGDTNYGAGINYSEDIKIGNFSLGQQNGNGNNICIGAYCMYAATVQTNVYQYGNFTGLGYGFANVYVGNESGGAVGAGNAGCTTIAANSYNTGIGWRSGTAITCGYQNLFAAENSGIRVSTGFKNVILGVDAWGPSTGNSNIIIGYAAGNDTNNLTSGSGNLIIGSLAGGTLSTGNYNILIGQGADAPSGATTNFLNIANAIYATGTGTSGVTPSGALVGIGTAAPQSKLQVNGGEVQVGTSGNACNGNTAGAISYNSATLSYCNGSAWTALAASGGVTSFSAGTTGLTPNTGTTGAVTLAGTLAVANGGTGVTSSTGTGSVVLSASPALTGTVTGASSTWTGQVAVGSSNLNSTYPLSVYSSTLAGYGWTFAMNGSNPAIYLGTAAPTSTNYTLEQVGADTYLMAQSGGKVRIGAANAVNLILNGAFTTIGGSTAGGASTLWVNSNEAIGASQGSTVAPTNGLVVQGNVGIGTTTGITNQLMLGNASSHAGQATCWTTNGAIGYCTSVVGASGGCTCTGL